PPRRWRAQRAVAKAARGVVCAAATVGRHRRGRRCYCGHGGPLLSQVRCQVGGNRQPYDAASACRTGKKPAPPRGTVLALHKPRMPSALQPSVRDAVRAESGPLLIGRLRWTLVISIIGLVLSAVSDLRFAPPPYDLILLKLGGAAAQAAAVGLLSLISRARWP